MKKYLLTALLGVFGLFSAFTYADTVDGFTSESQIYKYTINSQIETSDIYEDFPSDMSSQNLYLCSYSSPFPYTIYLDSYIEGSESFEYVANSNVYCFPVIESLFNGGDEIGIYSSSDNNVSQNGTLYLSNSPITYSVPSGGNGGSGGSGNSPLLSGGVVSFSGLISGLSNVLFEFIPYLVYLGLGIIVSVIGFVAIRWLMNWTQAKIRGTFSSGKRRR